MQTAAFRLPKALSLSRVALTAKQAAAALTDTTRALKVYAWKKPKIGAFYQEQSKQDDLGVPIGSYKGLDFHLTLERLSMAQHGKCMSLPYEALMEESQAELGLVALRMIQCAIGAWACKRRKRPANPIAPLP